MLDRCPQRLPIVFVLVSAILATEDMLLYGSMPLIPKNNCHNMSFNHLLAFMTYRKVLYPIQYPSYLVFEIQLKVMNLVRNT